MNDDYFIARKNPDLIPISVIEGIRAEIKKWDKEPACYILSYDANKRFNELINEHIKEYVNDKRRS